MGLLDKVTRTEMRSRDWDRLDEEDEPGSFFQPLEDELTQEVVAEEEAEDGKSVPTQYPPFSNGMKPEISESHCSSAVRKQLGKSTDAVQGTHVGPQLIIADNLLSITPIV